MTTQEELVTRLKHLFGEDDVISEWNVARNSRDALTRGLYCPRIDVVVGPFNIDANLDPNNRAISEAYETNLGLIEAIRTRSDTQRRRLDLNDNPRCFIAIEVENRTGAKHRIGSIVNASAMGKIGIVTTDSRNDFDKIVKIRQYLDFLRSVGKTQYNPQNVMIILAEDLFEVLNQATHRRTRPNSSET